MKKTIYYMIIIGWFFACSKSDQEENSKSNYSGPNVEKESRSYNDYRYPKTNTICEIQDYTKKVAKSPVIDKRNSILYDQHRDTILERPYIAENGDIRNKDNDFDGRLEPTYVNGHIRKGRYVRSHYRALPGK